MHGWFVASVLDQHGKDIGNGQYPNDVGYAWAQSLSA
jgi:hypothetical protein